MGHIVHAADRGIEQSDHGRSPVDRHILRQLIVGALNKRAYHSEEWLAASLGDAGSQRYSFLLGDANVDELTTCLTPTLGSEAYDTRSAGSDSHDRWIFLHHSEQIFSSQCTIIGSFADMQRIACGAIKRTAKMEALLIGLSRSIPFALLRAYMQNDRMIDVTYILKCLYECRYVISISHIAIVESERTEEISRTITIGFTELTEIFI